MKKLKEFALYKGDKLLSVGTVKEIAEETGLKPTTVRFYYYPAYEKRSKNKANRKVLICLDDGDEE